LVTTRPREKFLCKLISLDEMEWSKKQSNATVPLRAVVGEGNIN
jgi:hypothetical protein